MLASAVLFALLAGASAATWSICLKLGSTKVNAALGALVITGVAFLVNAIALVAMRASGQEIVFKPNAFWLPPRDPTEKGLCSENTPSPQLALRPRVRA